MAQSNILRKSLLLNSTHNIEYVRVGDLFNLASFVAALIVTLVLLTGINVIEELYNMMDQLMEKTKEEGLEKASLREMLR